MTIEKIKFRIGTYNLENLFDRFDDPYSKGDDPWKNRSTSPKPLKKLYNMGARIRTSQVHILALQEVENYGALRDFFEGHVGHKQYKVRDGLVSLPSNDWRGIDLALASKFPLGRVISHRHAKFGVKNKNMFSRDCLEIEILHPKKKDEVLLTVYNCHLKSKYSEFDPIKNPKKYQASQKKSAGKRAAEIDEIIRIVRASRNVDQDKFAIVGDMNDTPESNSLEGFLAKGNKLGLFSATSSLYPDNYEDRYEKKLKGESYEDKDKKKRHHTHKWSRKDKNGKKKTTYSQLDYILCSKSLWKCFNGNVKVEQRGFTKGSDHYLSYAEFEIQPVL